MNLPESWFEMEDEQARGFEAELLRECVPGHVLYGVEARAAATAEYNDDALFLLPEGRAAVVHLTWKTETSPGWPATVVYETLEQALAAIHADHAERSAF